MSSWKKYKTKFLRGHYIHILDSYQVISMCISDWMAAGQLAAGCRKVASIQFWTRWGKRRGEDVFDGTSWNKCWTCYCGEDDGDLQTNCITLLFSLFFSFPLNDLLVYTRRRRKKIRGNSVTILLVVWKCKWTTFINKHGSSLRWVVRCEEKVVSWFGKKNIYEEEARDCIFLCLPAFGKVLYGMR